MENGKTFGIDKPETQSKLVRVERNLNKEKGENLKMCDTQTSNKIQETVKALVSKGEAFSAYDVSTIVRGLGFSDYHSAMKKVVHEMFDRGEMDDYRQTPVRYPNSPREAFMYHPPTIDPSDPTVFQQLVDKIKNSAALPSSNVASATVVQSPALPAPSGSASHKKRIDPPRPVVDADGTVHKVLGTQPESTLYVPQTMAKAVGIAPRGKAYLVIDPSNKVVAVSASAPKNLTGKAQTTHVDRNQNIRIGRTALLKANIQGKVQIKLDGNEIKVSQD